jgi:outer membrane protein OmpA-like peptidoglycan-associated protein
MSERIIGVNDVKFIYGEDIRLNRRNVIYKSEQFQKIMDMYMDIEIKEYQMSNSYEFEQFKFDSFEINMKIQELLERNKNELTDVKIEVVGYF